MAILIGTILAPGCNTRARAGEALRPQPGLDRGGVMTALRFRPTGNWPVGYPRSGAAFRDTLVAGQAALIWQGSESTTIAAHDAKLDHSLATGHRWYLFILPHNGAAARLYACREQDLAAIAAAQDVVVTTYSTEQTWRPYQRLPRAITVVCVPWLLGDGLDPWVDTFYTGQVGEMAFGPDGYLYATVSGGVGPAPFFNIGLKIIRIAPDKSFTVVADLHTVSAFYAQISVGFDFTTPFFYTGIAVDATTIYYSTTQGTVRAMALDGSGDHVIAGITNSIGYNGDGAATATRLGRGPCALSLAPDGLSLLLADFSNGMIRRLTFSTANIVTVAGGVLSYDHTHPAFFTDYGDGFTNSGQGDGGPATAINTYVAGPTCVQQLGADVYASAGVLAEVRKVTASTGIISTYDGGGTGLYSSTGGDGQNIYHFGFNCPDPGGEGDRYAFLFDRIGAFFTNWCGSIRRNHTIVSNYPPYRPGRASSLAVFGLGFSGQAISSYAVDAANILYAAIAGRVVRFVCDPPICIAASPAMRIVAGSATNAGRTGGSGAAMRLTTIADILYAYLGDALFILEYTYGDLWIYHPGSDTSLITWSGIGGVVPQSRLAVGGPGNLYYVSTEVSVGYIRIWVSYDGHTGPAYLIGCASGAGSAPPCAAGAIHLASHGGMAFSRDGQYLYICDPLVGKLYRVTMATMVVDLYAGSTGVANDPDSATAAFANYQTSPRSIAAANLAQPYDVAVDPVGGDIWILSRQFSAVSRIAGDQVYRETGVAPREDTIPPLRGYRGDGAPALTQYDLGPPDHLPNGQFNLPSRIEVDTCGNVLIADSGNGVARYIDPTGELHTLAGGDGRDLLAGTATGTVLGNGVTLPANGTRLPPGLTGIAAGPSCTYLAFATCIVRVQ